TGRASQATREVHLVLPARTFGSGTTLDVVTRIRVADELNAKDATTRVRPLGAGESRRHEKRQEQSARNDERLIHGAPPFGAMGRATFTRGNPHSPHPDRASTCGFAVIKPRGAEPRAEQFVHGNLARVVRHTRVDREPTRTSKLSRLGAAEVVKVTAKAAQ